MGIFKNINIVLAILIFVISYVAYLPYPPSRKFDELPKSQRDWYTQGKITEINGFKMFVRHQWIREKSSSPTVVFIHGFPSSSFDYHKLFDTLLMRFGNVLVFDHVGYGFSEKPASGFSYSCIEHADQTLSLLRSLGIHEAHFVAHDMGDSVLTEILNRRRLKLLPKYFDTMFKSVTFTNGGMMVKNIGFRISQRILLVPKLGEWLSHALVKLRIQAFSKKQLASLWGTSDESRASMDEDIEQLIALNEYNGGVLLMHKMIHYLRDRFVFEDRWLKSLKELDIPCGLIWGDSDAVSPPKMARDLNALAPNCKLTLLKGVGHFLMLENPKSWNDAINLS